MNFFSLFRSTFLVDRVGDEVMVMKDNSTPSVFKFEDASSGRYWYIRLLGTPEVPEWISSDLVAVLYPEAEPIEYPNYFAQVPPQWKSQKKILTPDGEELVTTVYEPGLYYLIAHSNSSLIISFQKWMNEEVLPSIRPTGRYSILGETTSEKPSTKDRLETIRLGMNLLYELGGIDEKTRLSLREQVREILLEETKLPKTVGFLRGKAEENQLNMAKSLEIIQKNSKTYTPQAEIQRIEE
ncbi:MAG: BRO family protein [Microcystaceae cyanobacterium]